MTPETSEATKSCVVCAKQIPAAAHKCTECDSYQAHFVRFLGGINFSALSALIPAATLAWAFIYDRLQPGRSELKASVVECRREEVVVFATNLGDRAAVVRSAAFRIDAIGSPLAVRPLAFAGKDPLGRVLDAGSREILLLRTPDIGGAAIPLVPDHISREDCKIITMLDVIDFDQGATSRELDCACPS